MPIFEANDLLLLASANIGLRLTNKKKEATDGGWGDAIPLSHLAGAYDIIKFITLSNESEVSRNQMELIYKEYKEHHLESIACMPRILLHYAAEHDIGDAKIRLSSYKETEHVSKWSLELQVEAINAEVKKIKSFHDFRGQHALAYIVENLPYLAAELAYHFNEKFQLRLTLNWIGFANDDDMAYLVLSDGRDMYTYQSGYDFHNYPMGKIGKKEFIGKSVKAYLEFKGGEHRTLESKNSLEARLVKEIKAILQSQQNKPLSELEENIQTKFTDHDDYPAACLAMATLILMIIAALVAKILTTVDECANTSQASSCRI